MRDTLSDTIRTELVKAMGRCAECGRGGLSYRDAAKEIGIDHATLYRFVNGGGVQSDKLDAVASWLDGRKGKPRKEERP